jgi:hypothetical protein
MIWLQTTPRHCAALDKPPARNPGSGRLKPEIHPMNNNTVAITAVIGVVCIIALLRAERRDVPLVAKNLAPIALALLKLQ